MNPLNSTDGAAANAERRATLSAAGATQWVYPRRCVWSRAESRIHSATQL